MDSSGRKLGPDGPEDRSGVDTLKKRKTESNMGKLSQGGGKIDFNRPQLQTGNIGLLRLTTSTLLLATPLDLPRARKGGGRPERRRETGDLQEPKKK